MHTNSSYVNKTGLIFMCILMLSAFNRMYAQGGGKWMWVNGDSSGTYSYGTKGVWDTTNQPPQRYEPAYWVDFKGNFWLFGGSAGYSSFCYNDLWKFDPKRNEWIWVSGPKLLTHPIGVYGTQRVPSTLNYPPSRGFGANCWTDKKGDLWLFGGVGYDSTGSYSFLNDLWRYHIATNEWTWMGGSKLGAANAHYGTKTVAAASNWPGALSESKSGWTDDNNNLWMFGGYTGTRRSNDMWKYSISTNEWTYMKGDTTITGLNGHVGKKGVEDAANLPAGTLSYVRWKDNDGYFYIYSTWYSAINDMWRYNPKTNNWTMIWGDTILSDKTYKDSGQYKSYCTLGPGNYPGSRYENPSPAYVTNKTIMWNFGGAVSYRGALNDLWYFDPVTYKWTWVSGEAHEDDTGHYGIRGVASAANRPYARGGCAIWTDSANNVWIFSGSAVKTGTDLWKFIPDTSCVRFSKPKTIIALKSLPVDTTLCSGNILAVSYAGFKNIRVVPAGYVTVDTSAKTITFAPVITTLYRVYYASDSAKDTLKVTVHVLKHDSISKSATLCQGHHYILPKGEMVYTSGTYNDTLTNHYGCDSIITTVITVNPVYAINVSADICEGQTYKLPKSGLANASGIYHDTLTTWLGCDSIITTTLNVSPMPVAAFNFTPGRIILEKQPAVLLHNESLNAYTLDWLYNNKIIARTADTSITFSIPGQYCFTLKTFTSAVCMDTVQHCITVIDTSLIAVPEAFTPNGDGNNDVFFPITTGSMHIKEFRVYDRWGELMYDKPTRGWDGTYHGQPQPQGTYVYVVLAENLSDPNAPKKLTQKGDVELIR